MSKIKLTRKTVIIKIKPRDGHQYIPIKAWVYNGLLSWHKENKSWVLTHIPTGCSIITYNGKYEHIRTIINEIKDLVDWNHDNINIIRDLLKQNLWRIKQVVAEYDNKKG